MNFYRFLVVDDENDIRHSLEMLLKKHYKKSQVFTESNGVDAIKTLRHNKVDLIISDMIMPAMDGMDLLHQVKSEMPDIQFIMITGYATVESGVRAMKEGASDYITKPFDEDAVILQVSRCLKMKKLQEIDLRNSAALEGLIFKSKKMKELTDEIEKISAEEAEVLITGESGVGKDLVARLIHYNHKSKRKTLPFLNQNCAAIPDSLLESILFGHKKGTFTGATDDADGLFKKADGGTIFLNEIGDMPLLLQAKVLNVIESQDFRPVGGTENIKVNVRLISATNKDLSEEIEKGTFRSDLYWRISTYPIKIPALRERREDIADLSKHFIKTISINNGKEIKDISSNALSLLEAYPFPGNVRELRSIILRASISCNGDMIEPAHLPEYIKSYKEGNASKKFTDLSNIGLADVVKSFRAHGSFDKSDKLGQLVENIIDQNKGNVTELCSKLKTTSLSWQIGTTPDKINRAVNQSNGKLFYAVVDNGKVKKCEQKRKTKNCFVYAASKLND